LKFHNISGLDVIKILVKEFEFETIRQSGSHVILRKYKDGKKMTTVVPLHDEIKPGTLLGILALGGINKDEFLDKI
jgi:predicted RNA binding protein YcfA (HicA-like mRNA interferase family)